jgi:peptidyl-prolyl cis-trans isomerase D
MFDFVRKHTKIMMVLMFLLIIPAFVLVGINGFKSVSGGGDTVAKVGSKSIKQMEWDVAHKNEADSLRASMPNIDPKLLDAPQARYATLERLVRDNVLSMAAQDLHLVTSDVRLARELQRDPTIAGLRKPDGTLDMERYRQLAASQGLTPAGLEARVRVELSVRQLESGITASAFVPVASASASFNAFFERREVQIANFLPSDYASKVSTSDADLDAFYQANTARFQSPESADIEYLVLDLDSVKKSITLNEQDLRSYYDQNSARLSGKEERRASHILISAPKDAPAADRQKAKERAVALLEQVRKKPESFGDVARANSQDPGSAPNGGDLDFFARGAMVKPFEDAAFAMKKGDISDIVESDFGFHIIKLTDVRAPKQKPFEELRAGIESDLKSQQAQRKFAELSETFANTVYEQSDSLKPAADKLKLEIKTASRVTRQGVPVTDRLLSNPKLLTALFSPDSIEKKRNTEAIEAGVNEMVSARIVRYNAAKTQALAEVKSTVRDLLVATRSTELAKNEGAEKLKALKSKPDAQTFKPAMVISRDQGQSLPALLLNAAMHADISTLPALAGVDLGTQGYAIIRVNKVLERTAPTEATAKQELAQYQQWLARAESQAYYGMLKNQYKVQIKVTKPAQLMEAEDKANAQ